MGRKAVQTVLNYVEKINQLINKSVRLRHLNYWAGGGFFYLFLVSLYVCVCVFVDLCVCLLGV